MHRRSRAKLPVAAIRGWTICVIPAASRATSVEAHSVITMSDDLEIIAFSRVEKLWSWLEHHHATHPGAWVQLQKASRAVASIGLHDPLEAGIAYGWSESTRRGARIRAAKSLVGAVTSRKDWSHPRKSGAHDSDFLGSENVTR
jgi:hypothetical protein